MNLKHRNQCAFTFVELLVTIATISILAALVIPNYAQLKTRAFNATAESDYRNFKVALEADTSDPDSTASMIVFSQTGPMVLGGLDSTMVLSDGVQLNYAISLKLISPLATLRWLLLSVQHTKGDIEYRYWDLNGVRTEQRISIS